MCGATCDSDVTLAAIMGIISYLQMRAVSGGLGLPFIGWQSRAWGRIQHFIEEDGGVGGRNYFSIQVGWELVERKNS